MIWCYGPLKVQFWDFIKNSRRFISNLLASACLVASTKYAVFATAGSEHREKNVV
jgi:hypothetical protein